MVPEVAVNAAPQLLYSSGDAPNPGHVKEIVPGILWIRMPFPTASLNHINLWALRDQHGVALVDTGVHDSTTAACWKKLFDHDGDLAGTPPSRVMVTHMHPDHIGMAGPLTREYGCPLWVTRLEYLTCRALVADTGRDAPDVGVQFYRRAGWSDESIEQYRLRFGEFGRAIAPLPDSFERLDDGDAIRIGSYEWRVVIGNGHSPEHACLYCPEARVFVSGDQVLPRISSNVSVFPTEPNADPMNDWLTSLEKIRWMVPDDVLVLPAHHEPFRGLHLRLDQLVNGQQLALTRLRELLRQPARAVDTFKVLFRRAVDASSLGIATGESVACLNYLVKRGEVTTREDSDAVAWYQMRDQL